MADLKRYQMKDFVDLLEDTLKLHPNERAFFAEEVLKSLESPNLEIDKSWEEEAIKRYNAYKNNKVTAKNLDDVLSKYE